MSFSNKDPCGLDQLVSATPSPAELNCGPHHQDDTTRDAVVGHQAVIDALLLLNAFWQSEALVHQIATRDRRNKFRNIPVRSVSTAIQKALAEDERGNDVYFAMAEYRSAGNRKANNAIGARGFWVDMDCSHDKDEGGEGYRHFDDALQALKQFCRDAQLPTPTFVVKSGSGLHGHWGANALIPREIWKTAACKLKGLTMAHGLRADHSRTTDLASVLRIPGTQNRKYTPPRPVTLHSASQERLDATALLDALDTAFQRAYPPVADPAPVGSSDSTVVLRQSYSEIPSLAKLTSALNELDPDCDERTWKFGRLGPMAGVAKLYPELEEDLCALARSWSSGKLRGVPSKAWTTPGNNGKSGKEIFGAVWDRFLRSNYAGKPVTLGTIYFDAKAQGWTWPANEFEMIDDVDSGEA